MCEIVGVLLEDGIPNRGWQRYLWFAVMGTLVAIAGFIVYAYLL